MKPLRLT